ncbi:MAG: SufD family Fe-S cluster assembly protein [Candidatus Thorarchaeota archaeon]|nr:SufD family Fe-S cluster assembly protein [Candidatus Thorarchaeota archaeon]
MTDIKDLKKRAERALGRTSAYGDDIDLSEFTFSDTEPRSIGVDGIPEEDRSLAEEVGFDTSQRQVSGSYMQFDNESILADVLIKQEGLEVIPTHEALKKYDWAWDYLWNAVPVDADKYTAISELQQYDGYFIRAMEGAIIEMPVQTCLVIKKGHSVQNVHNIVIAEPDSELHIITGCATPSDLERSLHLGVSEFYVKKNAKLTFTMVHKWNESVDVRPRSGTIVEENGVFISSYAILSPARTLQTYPKVRLVGRNARADLYSVVYGTKDSKYDVGGALILEAPGTGGKVVSRSIATEHSEIIARGELVGKVNRVRARLECNGLLLSENARIGAVPMLDAVAEGVELSHEATVGKVGADQLNYLMARGLTEEEATSLIVRGFMHLKAPDLPAPLQKAIDDAVKMTLEKGL